jgi:uncharacterized protein (DUF4415 family)
MRKEYDFNDAKPGRLAERSKQQITIRIEKDTVAWFKELSEQLGVPYQTLMNMYLTDCARKKKRLEFK